MIDSNILYRARLHWIIFFWPLFLLCIAMFVGTKYPQLHQVGGIFGMIALVWLLITWGTYYFSSLVIKDKQVILRTGWMVRQLIDIPLNKIESIDIRQNLLGSLLGYGSLVITGTGGSRQSMDLVSHPLTCRRHIEQLMHG